MNKRLNSDHGALDNNLSANSGARFLAWGACRPLRSVVYDVWLGRAQRVGSRIRLW